MIVDCTVLYRYAVRSVCRVHSELYSKRLLYCTRCLLPAIRYCTMYSTGIITGVINLYRYRHVQYRYCNTVYRYSTVPVLYSTVLYRHSALAVLNCFTVLGTILYYTIFHTYCTCTACRMPHPVLYNTPYLSSNTYGIDITLFVIFIPILPLEYPLKGRSI